MVGCALTVRRVSIVCCALIVCHVSVALTPCDHVFIQPVLSTCPLRTNSGCGKREARLNWSMVTCQDSTRLELP